MSDGKDVSTREFGASFKGFIDDAAPAAPGE
jgi:hypothetical protein